MTSTAGGIRPIITSQEGVPITAFEDQLKTDPLAFHLDNSWAKNAFLISDNSLDDPNDVANRYWSSADAKFTDARLGCNIGINPKPQFTRYSDIRAKGRVSGRNDVSPTATSGNFGMGRYYSEAIDDPAQTIYMRFGVEQFNSLSTFLSKAFSADDTALVRTGRATSAFYNLGKLAGTITVVVAFPAVAALVAGAQLLNWIFSRPTSKFYTLKPTMHTYWGAVNQLVNNIAINKGIFPKIMADDATKGQRLGQPYTLDQEYYNELSKMMPDVFPPSILDKKSAANYFDIYALANRAQRLANQAFLEDYDRLNQGSATDYTGYLQKQLTGSGTHTTYLNPSKPATFMSYINRVLTFGEYYESKDNNPRMEQDPRVDPNNPDPKAKKDPTTFTSFWNFFDAEFRDGSQFAVFKVEHTGAQNDSFTNAVMESQISQKLNSQSSEMRQARFAFADGNIIGGVAGATVGAVAGAVKDVALGALDGVTMGFSNLLAGLGGSGYLDIPKHWQSSSSSLSRSTYKMHLMSPYGNVISQMMNIYIPLAMILAAALPRSTGKQSYGPPFLCQVFDKGRQQIKLGMVESLSVNRGVSHLAFDVKGNAMAIDVQFTVVDLSSIVHMPISTGELFGGDAGLDEDNILADYLAVLAGQDLYTQLYAMPKAKLRIAKAIANAGKLTSPAFWASMVHDSATAGVLQYVTLGAGHVLEAFVRQPEVSAGTIQ